MELLYSLFSMVALLMLLATFLGCAVKLFIGMLRALGYPTLLALIWAGDQFSAPQLDVPSRGSKRLYMDFAAAVCTLINVSVAVTLYGRVDPEHSQFLQRLGAAVPPMQVVLYLISIGAIYALSKYVRSDYEDVFGRIDKMSVPGPWKKSLPE